MKDEIVDEMRRNKDQYASQFNYDINKIYEDLKKQEKLQKATKVKFQPKKTLKRTGS